MQLTSGYTIFILGLFAGVIGIVWVAKNRYSNKYTPGGTTIGYSSSFNQDQTYGVQRPVFRIEELMRRGISYYNSGDYANAAVYMIEVLKIDLNNTRAKEILLQSLQRLRGG